MHIRGPYSQGRSTHGWVNNYSYSGCGGSGGGGGESHVVAVDIMIHILHHLSLPRTRRFLSCFSGSDLVKCAWGFPVTDSERRSLGLGLMQDVFLVTDTELINRGKENLS